jgi:hypothetical protein
MLSSLDRQPGFSNSTRPDDRKQRTLGIAQQLSKGGQLRIAPDWEYLNKIRRIMGLLVVK